ncbi:cytochrome p450 [Fusarium bulbicola]|nr:cytochrome p450 [Fusarium bulbicola]
MALIQTLLFSGAPSIRSVATVGVLVILSWLLWRIIEEKRFERRYRLPNLVPGLPLIGNSHQIPPDNALLHFQKLAKKYGEMFTVKIGGVYWLFLNSRRVSNELLDKRAAIYSSRMSLPMASDLLSNQKRMVLLPYGDSWRRERKVMHQILNGTNAPEFEPYQDVESKTLLFNYLSNPQAWYKAHSTYSGSIIMSVVFGRRADLEDANLCESLAVSEQFVQYLVPGRAMVDHFPFLTQFPWLKGLQPWRWYGDALYRRTRMVYKRELDGLRERMKSGSYKPCFMSEFLNLGHDQEFDQDDLYFMAGALMEAGTDTTRTSLDQIIASVVLFPDWAERARKELDEVCGTNAERLPTAKDAPKLPRIKAAVKESLRWKPIIGETGIPHALTRDDEFEGYKIPAGTVVTYNHWAISNDPEEYEEPERFWPERFIDEDLDKPLQGHLGFGTGRRVCVGYNVGTTNLFIAIARILYCFDIQGADDTPIDTSKPLYGIDSIPPFKVHVKPRSEAHAELIRRECSDLTITS